MNLRLKVDKAGKTSRVGHQYLFMVIPFGTIYLPEPAVWVTNEAYRCLALKGISPKLDASAHNIPTLTLRITDLSVSAFDLFVIRKIVAHVTIVAELSSRDGIVLQKNSAEGTASTIAAYAFAPELEAVLREALQKSIGSAIAVLPHADQPG